MKQKAVKISNLFQYVLLGALPAFTIAYMAVQYVLLGNFSVDFLSSFLFGEPQLTGFFAALSVYLYKRILHTTEAMPSNRAFDLICAIVAGISACFLSQQFMWNTENAWAASNIKISYILADALLCCALLLSAFLVFLSISLLKIAPSSDNEGTYFDHECTATSAVMIASVVVVLISLFSLGLAADNDKNLRQALLTVDATDPAFEEAQTVLEDTLTEEYANHKANSYFWDKDFEFELNLIKGFSEENIERTTDKRIKVEFPDRAYSKLACYRTSDTTVSFDTYEINDSKALTQALIARACMIAFKSGQ